MILVEDLESLCRFTRIPEIPWPSPVDLGHPIDSGRDRRVLTAPCGLLRPLFERLGVANAIGLDRVGLVQGWLEKNAKPTSDKVIRGRRVPESAGGSARSLVIDYQGRLTPTLPTSPMGESMSRRLLLPFLLSAILANNASVAQTSRKMPNGQTPSANPAAFGPSGVPPGFHEQGDIPFWINPMIPFGGARIDFKNPDAAVQGFHRDWKRIRSLIVEEPKDKVAKLTEEERKTLKRAVDLVAKNRIKEALDALQGLSTGRLVGKQGADDFNGWFVASAVSRANGTAVPSDEDLRLLESIAVGEVDEKALDLSFNGKQIEAVERLVQLELDRTDLRWYADLPAIGWRIGELIEDGNVDDAKRLLRAHELAIHGTQNGGLYGFRIDRPPRTSLIPPPSKAYARLGVEQATKLTKLANALAGRQPAKDARQNLERFLAELDAEFPMVQFKDGHPAIAYCHLMLAKASLDERDAKAASAHLEKSLDFYRGFCGSLGRLFLEESTAADRLQETLAMGQPQSKAKAPLPPRPGAEPTKFHLLLGQGRLNEARTEAENVLAVAQRKHPKPARGPMHLDLLDAMYNVGLVAVLQNDVEFAHRFLDPVIVDLKSRDRDDRLDAVLQAAITALGMLPVQLAKSAPDPVRRQSQFAARAAQEIFHAHGFERVGKIEDAYLAYLCACAFFTSGGQEHDLLSACEGLARTAARLSRPELSATYAEHALRIIQRNQSSGEGPLLVSIGGLLGGFEGLLMLANTGINRGDERTTLFKLESARQEILNTVVGGPGVPQRDLLRLVNYQVPYSNLVVAAARKFGWEAKTTYRLLAPTRGSTTAALANRRRDRGAIDDPLLRDMDSAIQKLRRELSILLVQLGNEGDADEQDRRGIRQEIENKAVLRDILDAELSRPWRLRPGKSDAQAWDADHLPNRLPSGVCFLDVVSFQSRIDPSIGVGARRPDAPDGYAVFIFTPDHEPKVIYLDDARAIDDSVRRWRREILGRELGEPSAKQVGEHVWNRIQSHVPSTTRSIMISAEGSLGEIPWAAMPIDDKGTILLERFEVRYTPGAAIWNRIARKRENRPSLLLVGDIDFDRADEDSAMNPRGLRPKKRWSLHPGMHLEIELARRAFESADEQGQVVRLGGADASVERVLDRLPKVQFAVLATHGAFANPELDLADPFLARPGLLADSFRLVENPLLLTFLVLAGANAPITRDATGAVLGNGGLLSAEALSGVELNQLELVVLSACQTAEGIPVEGETLRGLPRALHLAGAHQVIGSLWSIDDLTTAALMGRFYDYYWKEHMSAGGALRESQLYIRSHPNEITELAARRGDIVRVDPSRPKAGPNRRASSTMLWAPFILSTVDFDPVVKDGG